VTTQPDRPDPLIDPFNQAHSNADSDLDSDSIHHTLGQGPTQAAPGNHPGHLSTGFVAMYGGPDIPSGWLLCDGTTVSRNTYSKLFAVIGTTYGAGDGVSTFALPNFTNKLARGNTPGTGGGSDTHTHPAASAGTTDTDSHTHGFAITELTTSNSAAHTHPMTGIRTAGSGSLTSGGPSATVGPYTADASGATPGRGAHTHTTATHDHSIPSTDTSSSTTHSHGLSGATTNNDVHSHTISGTHSHAAGSNVPAYTGIKFLIKT